MSPQRGRKSVQHDFMIAKMMKELFLLVVEVPLQIQQLNANDRLPLQQRRRRNTSIRINIRAKIKRDISIRIRISTRRRRRARRSEAAVEADRKVLNPKEDINAMDTSKGVKVMMIEGHTAKDQERDERNADTAPKRDGVD